MLVPPAPEQDQIVRAIRDVEQPLDRAIENTERQIGLAREYRTRLIADVVTGKLDVREAAGRLPHEAEEPEPLDELDTPTDAKQSADDLDAVLAKADS